MIISTFNHHFSLSLFIKITKPISWERQNTNTKDLLRNYQQSVSSNRINSSVSWNHNKILLPYPEIDQAAYDVTDAVIAAQPVPEDILHYPELLYL